MPGAIRPRARLPGRHVTSGQPFSDSQGNTGRPATTVITQYARLRNGLVAWTAEASDDVSVDVDVDGRVLGIEVIGERDWRDGLWLLAVAGRLRITRKNEL